MNGAGSRLKIRISVLIIWDSCLVSVQFYRMLAGWLLFKSTFCVIPCKGFGKLMVGHQFFAEDGECR